MTPHKIAAELAELGKSDMRLMSRLAVHSERLCDVATLTTRAYATFNLTASQY